MGQIEEWKKIPGFNGQIEVSNYGRVRRIGHYTVSTTNRRRYFPDSYYTLKENENVQTRVEFEFGGEKYGFMVKSLVANAFLENKNGGSFVEHIDGNIRNNTVWNLRWSRFSESQEGEEWLPVNGYEGLYEISNMGRLRSLYNGVVTYGEKKKDGYMVFRLYKDHHGRVFLIHVLVAMAFLPNPKNKRYVDHINCIRSDNRAANLRWVTAKENANNPITLQRYRERPITPMSQEARQKLSEQRKGKKNPFFNQTHKAEFIERISKPLVQLTSDGKLVRVWKSATEASRELMVCREAINRCCRGLSKTSFGFRWVYKNDYDNRNAKQTE